MPKALISTCGGSGTIPDGFAIDLARRQWFIVEAELSRHSVWNHVAPQVAKQLIAALNAATKHLLVKLTTQRVKDEEELKERFEELSIQPIDIWKVLWEILDTNPIIAMPIDDVAADLEEWARTLKADVRLWIVRKLVEFGKPETIMYEFSDEFEGINPAPPALVVHSVTIVDLLHAGVLQTGEKLDMSYKPKSGERKTYEGVVQDDGSIKVLEDVFSTPSYTALYAMQDAGTTRKTVNGWDTWKTASGKTLDDLRKEFLAKEQIPAP